MELWLVALAIVALVVAVWYMWTGGSAKKDVVTKITKDPGRPHPDAKIEAAYVELDKLLTTVSDWEKANPGWKDETATIQERDALLKLTNASITKKRAEIAELVAAYDARNKAVPFTRN